MHVSRQSLNLYCVNKALSLHNILVFSFHTYRTRQMSVNGGTKKEFFCDHIIVYCKSLIFREYYIFVKFPHE